MNAEHDKQWLVSDYFRAWYSADGPQNYAYWNNPRFDETLLKIDREVDGTKRLAYIREAENSWRTIRPCCQ